MTPEQRNNMASFQVYALVSCMACTSSQIGKIERREDDEITQEEYDNRIIRESEIKNDFTMINHVTCTVHGGAAIFIETGHQKVTK